MTVVSSSSSEESEGLRRRRGGRSSIITASPESLDDSLRSAVRKPVLDGILLSGEDSSITTISSSDSFMTLGDRLRRLGRTTRVSITWDLELLS